MTPSYDICIRGGGVVGRTLALLLAREKLRVGLVERPAPQAAQADARTAARTDVRAYALTPASHELLDGLRAWPQDETLVTPVLQMQIHGDAGSELHFDSATLATNALAWIVDAAELETRLKEALRYQPQIELLTAPVPAKLTVICEGRASSTRAELGVDFDVAPYDHHAVAARLGCELPHGQTARQWFANGEVLALLPLAGTQGREVALVWSVAPQRAVHLQQLAPQDFCRELEHACGSALGAMKLASERQSWPLQRAQARRWTGVNANGAWALAGDAAHNVHPLAGQGLNLGLADAAELACVLRGREDWREVGDAKLLRRYERARKAGMLALDTGMDGLQMLYAREGAFWEKLRAFGLRSINQSGWLKHQLAKQAMHG